MADSHSGYLREFGGLPVVDWPAAGDEGKHGRTSAAAGEVAWRVSVPCYGAEETWPEAFARFAAAVDPGQVRALVVGAWPEAYEGGSGELAEVLTAAREKLTSLRALFIGDMTSEECEISWITQSDLTPLLAAFPALEVFGIRGGSGLSFPPVRHEGLRELVVESGGLSAEVVRGIAACDFPALEKLELWLGTSWYGGDSEVADMADILSGVRLPALRSLGLCDSEIQDRIAAACASAPVVARLDVLDLSMGVLTDEGAEALLAGQPLTHLKKLDLNHNYLSEEVAEKVRQALEPAGVVLDLDRGDADEYEDEDGTVERFVSVGE
jgi:hypothetical protein